MPILLMYRLWLILTGALWAVLVTDLNTKVPLGPSIGEEWLIGEKQIPVSMAMPKQVVTGQKVVGSSPGKLDLLISCSVSGLFSANQSNMAPTFLMWRDMSQGRASQEIENSAPGRRQTYNFWIKRHVLNHFATITGVSFKAIEIVNLLSIHLNS